MNRLQCTQPELHAMDAGNLEIFLAFARGEAEATKQKNAELEMLAGMKQRR